MPNVSPARFADKTDDEVKLYSLDWRNAIGTETIESAQWRSWPEGLAFSDQTITGTVTQVRISGGVPGTEYRVRCLATLEGTGEKLEAANGSEPGVSLRVLAYPVQSGGLGTVRDDYGRGPY